MTFTITRQAVFLVAAATLMSMGCAGGLAPLSHQELRQRYEDAITDASVAETDEIYRKLVAIVPANKELIWRGTAQDRQVLVVTWTSWTGYDDNVGKPMQVYRNVWVTVVPEIKKFVEDKRVKAADVTIRIEQLLGLPPSNGKTRFVEMWVRPADLFRPSADPEITDRVSSLDFPEYGAFLTLDPEYIQWFSEQKKNSYSKEGYPWTRLGYTYDWGKRNDEIGLSEFVIKKGAQVEIRAVASTHDYFQ